MAEFSIFSLPQPLATTDAPTFLSLSAATIRGGSSSGGNLTLSSTSNGTKGKLLFGTSAYDEVNNRLGIGIASPSWQLAVDANNSTTGEISSVGLAGTFPNIRGSILHGLNGGGYLSLGGLQIIAQGANNSSAGSANINFITANANSANASTDASLSLRFQITYLGNFGFGTTNYGTSAQNVLAIGNGTEPGSSPADMIQLYSVDLSDGNATLGLRTETPVVTETVVSDRTLSVRINGTTYKLCLKV